MPSLIRRCVESEGDGGAEWTPAAGRRRAKVVALLGPMAAASDDDEEAVLDMDHRESGER